MLNVNQNNQPQGEMLNVNQNNQLQGEMLNVNQNYQHQGEMLNGNQNYQDDRSGMDAGEAIEDPMGAARDDSVITNGGESVEGQIGDVHPNDPVPGSDDFPPPDNDNDVDIIANSPEERTGTNMNRETRRKRPRICADRDDPVEESAPKKIILEERNKARVQKSQTSKQIPISLEKGDKVIVGWEGEEISATVLSRAGKVTGNLYNYFNLELANTLQYCMNMEAVQWRRLGQEECNMVLIPRERHKELQVREAKKKELEKLKYWDAVDVIEDEGQFRISCTWVVWMKPLESGDEECRARLVARGYEEEYEVQSDSPTVDKACIRLIMMMCASNKWTIKTSDVTSAFLQGMELDRLVVIKPPRESGVPKGKLWRLKVALYGLDDASLRFYQKVASTCEELKLTQSKLSPAFFYRLDEDGKIEGVLGTHVDDFLHGGSDAFEKNVTNKLDSVFQMGKTASKQFKYVGLEVEQMDDFSIKVSQEGYAKDIEMVHIDPRRKKEKNEQLTEEEKSLLRKAAGKLGWLGRQTRPDLLFSQVEMSTRFVRGTVEDLINAQKAVKRVSTQRNFIHFKSLGPVTGWKIEVSTDAAHRNLQDAYSTGALVILIRGEGDSIAPLFWQCNKIQRICGSTLEAEMLALVEGMGHAVYTRELIEEITKAEHKTIPIEMLVDNEGACLAVRGHCAVSDKRLNIELSRAREYRMEDNIAVNWIPSREQLADPLTKKTADSTELIRTFQEGIKPRRKNQKTN